MSVIAEALASGRQGAVKISVLYEAPPSEGEKVRLESEASSAYRRAYGHWCDPRPTVTLREGPPA